MSAAVALTVAWFTCGASTALITIALISADDDQHSIGTIIGALAKAFIGGPISLIVLVWIIAKHLRGGQ